MIAKQIPLIQTTCVENSDKNMYGDHRYKNGYLNKCKRQQIMVKEQFLMDNNRSSL